MRAIILAGGKGTRLKPYTTLIPKPLVPIGEKYAIVEIVIKQLITCGFNHVTLAVNHLSRLIMAYFGDGSDLGIKIDYSVESTELGTIGPLTLINDLPDNFLVMNGDILSNIGYEYFLGKHIKGRHDISVAAFQRKVKIDYGVLESNNDGSLNEFREKPEINVEVSMGVYCLNRNVIEQLKNNEPYGFDQFMIDSINVKRNVNIYRFNDFWLDIGREEDYASANAEWDLISQKLGIER